MDSITWQPGVTLEQMEKSIILKAYRFFSFNKTQTALSLGIAIRTLDSKLEEYKKETEDAEQKEVLRPDSRTEPVRQLSEREKIFNTRMEAATKLQKADGPYGDNPQRGVHIQPAPQVTEEHALPMQVGAEVQTVPPEQTGGSNKSKRRRRNHESNGKSGDSRIR